MYAPKFQSWLTDEERFHSALDYKLNVMAEAALKELREMCADAMPKEPEKPVDVMAMYQGAILDGLANAGWSAARWSSDPYAGLGGASYSSGLMDLAGGSWRCLYP